MSTISETNANAVRHALAVMQAHIDGINERDENAIGATLHFPHYRLSDGKLKVWETQASYFNDFRKRAGNKWDHSKWGKLDVVHVGADKVHLDVQVDRYAADGSLLISFSSLWVIALLDDRWAAQLRSTFAPDTRIIAQSNRT